MDRTRLSDLPAKAQATLKAMSREDLDLLLCEIRGRQADDRLSRYPSEAEAAARGARECMRQPASLEIEEPLELFAALFGLARKVVAYGATGGLDKSDCAELWELLDLANDLLTTHRLATNEARDRLRAFTHPAGQSRANATAPNA